MAAPLPKHLYTIDAFMALPDDGKRYELWEGRLVEMSPTSGLHKIISAAMVEFLRAYARPRKLGHVFSVGAEFTIDAAANIALAPDAAFVVRGRITFPLPPDTAVLVPPDLAVEVLPRHDYEHPKQTRAKITTYQNAGVRLVWILDQRRSRAQIYRLGTDTPQTIGLDAELDGEDVLPGFRVKVRDLLEPEM